MSGSSSSGPEALAVPTEAGGGVVEPIGLTVHSLPRPDPAALEQRTRSGRLKMMLVLLICAAPVIASYLTYYVIRPQGRNNYADLIDPARPMPATLSLRTLSDEPVEPGMLRRQWLLVAVGPAACDASCRNRLLQQRQLHQMLGKDRDRVEKLWLVTDAGPADAALVSAVTQGADPLRILRVPRDELARWLEPAPGQRLDDHLFVIDPMGAWMMRAPLVPDPQKLKRDLERLLRASSAWDDAGR